MMLTVHDLDPGDVRHLFCSDPHLVAEVAAINRSLQRLDEGIPSWIYLDPGMTRTRKEVRQ